MTVSQLISSSCSQPLIKLKSNDLEVPASDTKSQQPFTSTLFISFGTDMLPIKALPPDRLQTHSPLAPCSRSGGGIWPLVGGTALGKMDRAVTTSLIPTNLGGATGRATQAI